MKKRIISLLLAVSFLCGAGILPAAAAESEAQPAPSLNFQKTIALGRLCSMVIKEDGTLWTWGHNYDGMMAVEPDGTEQFDTETDFGIVTYTSTPIQVPIDKQVISVEMSDHFTSIITADGELWNWGGGNAYGSLGRETGGEIASPGKVMGNVQDIGCGIGHAAALTRDGVLWLWGLNRLSQLGNGRLGTEGDNLYQGANFTSNYEVLPARVLDNVKAIEAGGDCTYAIRSDGSLWAWGNNTHGELGNDWSTWDKSAGETHDDDLLGVPVSYTNVREPGVYLETLLPDGNIMNLISDGGTFTNDYRVQTRPIKVMDGVKKVAAGCSFSYILKEDGSLYRAGSYGGWSFHDNPDGETFSERWHQLYTYAPELIMEDVADVEIYTRGFTVAILKTDGTLWTDDGSYDELDYGVPGWGYGEDGKPIYINWDGPIKVLDDVVEVVVGEGNMAALKSDGSLWMTGANALGQLGGATDEAQSFVFIKVMDGVALPASYTQSKQTLTPIVLSSAALTDTVPIQSEGPAVWDTTPWGNRPMSVPAGASYLNGNAYAIYTMERDVTWDEAENYCLSLGGHLVTITSREEQEFLQHLEGPIWIGGRRNPQGGWSWVTGENWGYQSWYTGQNDNYGGYEGALYLGYGTWGDVSNNTSGINRLICEWETSGRPLPTPPAPIYSVTFEAAQGAQLDTIRKQVVQGQTYGWLPTPYLEGYTFVGWYDGYDYSRLVTPSTVVNLNDSVHLFAKWTPNTGGPSVPRISYSFGNNSWDLNYPEGYRIPLDRYQYIFGNSSYANEVYNEQKLWDGSCYGMCATAAMLYMRDVAGITPDAFRPGAVIAGELKISDRNANLNLNLRQWIETVHVSQFNQINASRLAQTHNDYNGLVNAVLNFRNTGAEPIVIGITGAEGGHAVIGLSAWRKDANTDCITIYDPNWPNADRFIDLYRNAQGQYVGWSYDLNGDIRWGSAYGGDIRYSEYSILVTTWNDRGSENAAYGRMTMNCSNASIYDYSGNLVATVRNGEVNSLRSDVFPVPVGSDSAGAGGNNEGVSLWVPDEHFTVVNEDETVSELEVRVSGTDSSVSVSTSADRLLIYGGGEDSVVLVNGDSESYEITFTGKDGDKTLTGTTRAEVPTCFAQIDGVLSATDSRGQTGLEQTTVLDVMASTVAASVSSTFGDVPGDSYYAPAVQWALEKNVTDGTALGIFNPEGTCTRAEAVAFLWRAAGCPTSGLEAMPFTDIQESDDFYQAVLWAAGSGITVGTGAARFSPDRICSNWEFLTFLWRFLGSPGQGSELAAYEDAAAWADGQGLLKNTGIQTGLNTPCLRCDAVMFLYRVLA